VCVYIFKKIQNNWVEVQKITASNGQPGDEFGTSISADDDYLVVGAPRANSLGGLVYIYEREDELWNEMQIFSSPSSLSGISVSISAPYILIGSDEFASIFKLENDLWVFKQSLLPTNYSGFGLYGYSVSINEDNALVGAYFHSNENGASAGSAYLFKRDEETWIETQRILASDTLARFFGYSLDLQDNKAIIGAIWDDTFAPLNGAAYIYNFYNDSLVIDQKVFASDWDFDDRFGSAVTILGDIAVVGAYGVDLNTYDVGAAYIFKKENGGWLEVQKLTPSDIITDLQFGTSVALSPHSILVGAPATYAQEDTLGFAYVYDGIIVSVNQNDLSTVNSYRLEQNYPNPFNPSTKISWQSPVGSWQTLKVYDLLGREVATLVDEYRPAGEYEVEFSPESSIKYPATGIYFYTLRAGDFIQTRKMVLIK